jgi:hypothetical protein
MAVGGAHRPAAAPFDVDVLERRLHARGDPVALAGGEDDLAAIVALGEGGKDRWRVVLLAAAGRDSALFATVTEGDREGACGGGS